MFADICGLPMLEHFLSALQTFAMSRSDIECVLLAGSYANGTYKEDSDIDIVVVTSDQKTMLANQDFIKQFGVVEKKQIEYYGACTSVRVWYQNGQEVEFGIVDSSWLKQPLDPGTAPVLENGYQIIIDKKQYFEQ